MPKKNVEKPISPDTKLEVPADPFQPDEQPIMHLDQVLVPKMEFDFAGILNLKKNQRSTRN